MAYCFNAIAYFRFSWMHLGLGGECSVDPGLSDDGLKASGSAGECCEHVDLVGECSLTRAFFVKGSNIPDSVGRCFEHPNSFDECLCALDSADSFSCLVFQH